MLLVNQNWKFCHIRYVVFILLINKEYDYDYDYDYDYYDYYYYFYF